MHLYGDILERYVARELPPQNLAALDAHVSNCLSCAHALSDETSASTQWGRRGWLERLVRVDEPVVASADEAEEVRAEAA